MAKHKRFKIIITTISAAGYIDNKKCSNSITWKVCTIDEPNLKELIETERLKIEKTLQEATNTKLKIIAKTTKTESIYVDTFLSSEHPGETNKTERSIKIKH